MGSTAAYFRNIDWQLLFVRTVNILSYCWDIFKTQSVKTSRYIKDSFSSDIYVFYEGSSVPVSLRDYKEGATGSPGMSAFYNRDTRSIHTVWPPTSLNSHTMLFDSVTLHHRDINLYDLTDFFNETEFYGVTPASLDIWVASWCLEHSVFLDRKKTFTVRTKLMLEDDTKTFTLWTSDGDEKTEWAKMCRPPGTFHHQNLRRIDVSGNTVCMPTASVAEAPVEDVKMEEQPAEEESSKLE